MALCFYDKDDYNLWEKDIIEKTHLYFCKQVLGVKKQCSNAACRNELERLLLREITNTNVIKFWIHLENQPEDSIAKECLQISKGLADKNKKSTTLKVTDLCKKSNLNILNLTENNSLSSISRVRLTVNKEMTQHQLNFIKHNKKLILYSMFKTDCLRHKANF